MGIELLQWTPCWLVEKARKWSDKKWNIRMFVYNTVYIYIDVCTFIRLRMWCTYMFIHVYRYSISNQDCKSPMTHVGLRKRATYPVTKAYKQLQAQREQSIRDPRPVTWKAAKWIKHVETRHKPHKWPWSPIVRISTHGEQTFRWISFCKFQEGFKSISLWFLQNLIICRNPRDPLNNSL